MTQLTSDLLANDRLDEVYPLIRTVSGITPQRWAAYGRLLKRRGGHVMVVVDQAARIYGAASFRSGSTLRHENSLIVEAMAAFELGEGGTVKRVLCSALTTEAEARGCSTLVVQTKPATSLWSDRDIRGWAELGLELESVTMVLNVGHLHDYSFSHLQN